MGFLDKLFGNSKKQEETQTKNKVRAQFKDEKYFKGQIERCNRFIASDEKDDIEYIEKNGKLTAFHYLSSASTRVLKLENYYSVGESKQIIADLFDETIEIFIKGFSNDYQSSGLLLKMVSLSILLDVSKEKFNKIIDFIRIVDKSDIKERWKPDSLVFFLIGESDKLRKGFNKPNQRLFEITELTKLEAENAINNYIKDWYSMHKDEPWYNTHLRDDGYSGYWAWEVAAVVKVMGLNDGAFKNNPYYPYDIVHWDQITKSEYVPENLSVIDFPNSELAYVYNSKGNQVPIYEYPSNMVPPLEYLENNSQIFVVSSNKDAGWYEIFSKEKKKAYIQSNYVKKND